jgi:hypothetical protein
MCQELKELPSTKEIDDLNFMKANQAEAAKILGRRALRSYAKWADSIGKNELSSALMPFASEKVEFLYRDNVSRDYYSGNDEMWENIYSALFRHAGRIESSKKRFDIPPYAPVPMAEGDVAEAMQNGNGKPFLLARGDQPPGGRPPTNRPGGIEAQSFS